MSFRGFNSEAYHGAGSLHPGGMQVVLADGSVTFLAETMSWGTFAKLCAHQDNNTMASF